MDAAPIIAFVGILVFLSHLFSGIFSRTKIPDVLFLFIIGLCLGPFLGIISPSQFGIVGPIFTTVTLVIILFESGIGLHLDVLRGAMRNTLMLTLLNFIVTTIVVGIISLIYTGLDLLRAIMLGAIVSGTSSAVVIPLVAQLRLKNESSATLILEAAISDIFSVTVPLALLEAIKLGELRFGLMAGHMVASFTLALLFGAAGAFVWSILLNKVRTLQNAIFTTPAFVFIVFGVVESLGYAGAISSLAFGITMANVKFLKLPLLKKRLRPEPISLNKTEKAFFSEVVFLLKTFFFIYVGLSIKITDLWSVLLGFVLTLLIFAFRIPVVRFSVRRLTSVTDASLMSVIVPKGLAAAVLASIPLQQGIVGGEIIQSISYSVILSSIVLTSLLVFLMDKTGLSRFYAWVFSGLGRNPR